MKMDWLINIFKPNQDYPITHTNYDCFLINDIMQIIISMSMPIMRLFVLPRVCYQFYNLTRSYHNQLLYQYFPTVKKIICEKETVTIYTKRTTLKYFPQYWYYT